MQPCGVGPSPISSKAPNTFVLPAPVTATSAVLTKVIPNPFRIGTFREHSMSMGSGVRFTADLSATSSMEPTTFVYTVASKGLARWTLALLEPSRMSGDGLMELEQTALTLRCTYSGGPLVPQLTPNPGNNG